MATPIVKQVFPPDDFYTVVVVAIEMKWWLIVETWLTLACNITKCHPAGYLLFDGGKHLRADIIVHDTGSRAMISWHVACTYASELQAMEEELDLCYQDGVVFCATSNTAIGFPLFFRNWKLS